MAPFRLVSVLLTLAVAAIQVSCMATAQSNDVDDDRPGTSHLTNIIYFVLHQCTFICSCIFFQTKLSALMNVIISQAEKLVYLFPVNSYC